jgi:hypothetical protein
MKKIARTSLWAGVGLVGFTLAYVAFALVLGAQPHQIPVAGALFPAPPDEQASSSPPPAPGPSPRPEKVQKAELGLLDVFQVPSPYSSSELERLVDELELKRRELDQRLDELAEREKRASERAEFLDEQYAELQRLRIGLEQWENELEQRQAEVERDEAAKAERDAESWTKLGKLFADGDAAESGKRLVGYGAQDAAKILHTLKPSRAKELLDALPAERWKEFAEAYRTLEPASQR